LTSPATPVAIALGSNLGDRQKHLTFAIDRLRAALTNINVSRFIDTDPVGVDEPQPNYLNAVVTGETDLAPRALLERLLAIERERGRTRPSARASRTLDLDLILYGSQIINEGDLVVPHPRFRERVFVLEPLAEIAPDWIDPVTGKRIADLLT
jgi:2-amino-4-hydroxy-6-hydroxymethyldihydropteridine diphosphokinase